MKYENFNEAQKLVEQINKHQSMLDSLCSQQTTVIINSSEQCGRIMTIGVGPAYEHEYSHFAGHFVFKIKDDLKTKIHNLKEALETL